MLLVALAILATQQSALEAAERAAGKPVASAPSQQARTLLENCDAHKFETVIEVPAADGSTKHSRMKLCGTEGQSDADWLKTLKDAIAKTNGNQKMPAAIRSQIVTAINAEVARLESNPAPAAAAALPPPRAVMRTPALGEYTALPPLPDKPVTPVHVLAGGSAGLPMLPKPRISFICSTPGEVGEGPCTEFSRDTLLTVLAGEDLPGGTSLRFVRSGEAKADVKLAQLKRGRSMQMLLPTEVCRHAVGGSLAIRIVRSVPAAGAPGQEVGEDGPYNLRC